VNPARALAREFADNAAPVSVALTRQMIWRMAGAEHPMMAHRVDSRAIQARGQSADVREGVSAFLAKRPAVSSRRFRSLRANRDSTSADTLASFPSS
jgi:enoyl-CoA hydratase/carnithine racemase